MNKKPFSYHSTYGARFECETCDFSTPVIVTLDDTDMPMRLYGNDVAEMIGYHATNIWPELNGFQGYDTIRFVIN